MAKVTSRKETGKLVIDFTYRGVRCREQTALPDTPQNRKRAAVVVDRLKKAIAAGTFSYSEFFPGSALGARFSGSDAIQTPVAPPVDAPAVVNETPSFESFVSMWIAQHKVEWRRSHMKVLQSTLDAHLMPAFKAKPVGGITRSEVLQFRAQLAEKPGRGGGRISNKRINNIMGTLAQILNEAADEHGFTSPCMRIKRLKVVKPEIDPFSLADVELMLATVRPDWKDYLLVRAFTGMRTGEVHGLKWKYVDFERRLIYVRESIVLGEEDETKTEHSVRDIQMSQPVFEALRRQHAATSKLSQHVFCNREGNPIDNKNFTDRVWYPLLKHLGLKLRRPYQMRNTAATLWLASGEAPEWIAQQLGHANTQMLFTVYSRFVPNLTRRDGSAMDRLLATRFATGGTEPANDGQANAQAPPLKRQATG